MTKAAARLAQEVIRDKRDGRPLTADDIAAFVEGVSTDRVTDAQIAAFAMAVHFRGMARDETIALTQAMRDSGDVLDWSGLGRPVVDKHSTGGVGDNVSLMLAPILAACGAAVPMISGRGLGHTGGTLDKLESIPGYAISPDRRIFEATVRDVGCAIVAATGDFAPADKRIYGVRDVTATVESEPMIVASILSKKLAEGLGGLVLDVKAGSGAFMASHAEARSLARNLVEVANGAGLPTMALLTRMDEALASAAGNALEVRNAVRFLTGARRDPALEEVTLALAAEMLSLTKLGDGRANAAAMARRALDDGRAAEVFGRMVSALGGPADFVERMEDHLPGAPIVRPVPASATGSVAQVDARRIGMSVVELGGGRRRPDDRIDPSVGFSDLAPIGLHLNEGDPIGFVHAANEETADRASAALLEAYDLADGPVQRSPSAVIERIG